MPVVVGEIVEGVVTGITNFGAFIQLSEGKSGLVHISEISQDQKVKVKILSISKEGKISLSIRQAKPKTNKPVEIEWNKPDDKQKNMSFEDKLSRFLKESNERMDQIKVRDNKKNSGFRTKKTNIDL